MKKHILRIGLVLATLTLPMAAQAGDIRVHLGHHGGHGHKHHSGYRHHGNRYYGYRPGYSIGYSFNRPYRSHRYRSSHRDRDSYRSDHHYDSGYKRDCRQVSKIGQWHGKKARIGGTLCYDDYGNSQIVSGSRYLIEYYY